MTGPTLPGRILAVAAVALAALLAACGSDEPAEETTFQRPADTPAPSGRVLDASLIGNMLPVEDADTRYEVRFLDAPAAIVVPAGWQLSGLPGAAVWAPAGDNPAATILALTQVSILTASTPAALMQRIIDESEGAFVLLPDDGAPALPQGFEYTALVGTTRDFLVGQQPGRVLNNWSSANGATARWIIAPAGGVYIIGLLESLDWPQAQPFQSYLEEITLLPS